MSHYPSSILKLIESLSKFPGIGEKTAERLAMHVLRASNKEMAQLIISVKEVKEKIKLCSSCFALSDTSICKICSDQARTASVLCVVEQPADMVAIEKSGSFYGRYHILQGVLSPMNGVGPENIRIKELIDRITDEDIKEVVLATSTNVEGEATTIYLTRLLKPLGIRVSRIARGLPVGGDLEFADEATLSRALEGRIAL